MKGRGSGSDRGQFGAALRRHLDVEEQHVGRERRHGRARARRRCRPRPRPRRPPSSCSSAVSRARAGASSSTSTTRIMPPSRAPAPAPRPSGVTIGMLIAATCETARLVARQREGGRRSPKWPRSRSRTLRRPKCSPARRAEGRRSSEPATGPGRCRATAIVSRPPAHAGRHLERAVAAHLRDAVLDGVLDQRVHEHRRHLRAPRGRRRRRWCSAGARRSALPRRRGRPRRRPAPGRARAHSLSDRRSVWRNTSESCSTARSARAGSLWMSEATVLSALKRKCGLICARSAFSSDWLVCTRSSCASRSCSCRRCCSRTFSTR